MRQHRDGMECVKLLRAPKALPAKMVDLVLVPLAVLEV